jgi:hypothetical protein
VPVLSKTWKLELMAWTKWFGPTSPVVSFGVEPDMPSHDSIGAPSWLVLRTSLSS